MARDNSSIAKDLEKLKDLLKDGTLTQNEFELAKKRLLREISENNNQEEVEETQSGLKRKANWFDFLVVIIIAICAYALQKGTIGGVILGAVLGVIAFLTTKITKSIFGRIVLFVIFAASLTSLGYFFYPSSKAVENSESNSITTEQDTINETAWKSVYDGKKSYSNCVGTESRSYEFVSNCIVSSNFRVTKVSGTSCDNELNTVIDAFIKAKEHCGKAGFYESNGHIKPGVSVATYADEVSKCSAAIDQFSSLSYTCGGTVLLKYILAD